MKIILKVFVFVLIRLLAVLLFNTFSLKSNTTAISNPIDMRRDDTATLHLSEDIQIKVVSFRDIPCPLTLSNL